MVLFSPDNKNQFAAVYLCIYYMIFIQLCQLVESQNCDIRIEDELWPLQWYLNKSVGDKYDMNVLPAWRSCINGTGVTVGVVDKGVQNHIDLEINRRFDFSDVDGGTVASFQHGTRVAGVIGALKNKNFTIGIAFGSEIADIKIASTAVWDTFDVAAFYHHMDSIQVYSCSFANFHTGTKTYKLEKNQEDAFIRGTTQGRGGLGSVYVFATGNSGDVTELSHDSCAYDRLVTNRYVISVAGIMNDLSKVPNGEPCSAMMVAAFTAKGGAQHHKIVTTDVGNTSTEYFNQNSAAAPMVSGAVALALSANPNLSYRDVMHLLVLTSRGDLPEFKQGNYFMKNAANLSVSSYFGFGLLDMGALVQRSQGWKKVPARESCNANMYSPCCKAVEEYYHLVEVKSCTISYTEHVEVKLMINHPHAGQIQWVLTSPHGTKSTILPGRLLDSTRYMNLTVLTVQMWGENPNGFWKLKPTALFDRNLDGGRVENISLTIHGFDCSSSDLSCLKPAVQDESFFITPPPYEVTTDKTTDKPDKPDKPDENRKSINHSVIIIVGVLAVVCVVIVILLVVKRKKKLCFKERLRSKNSENSENYPTEQHIPLKC
ncbi:neuroendocrine convertase 1-like isoform X1 [Mytilus californianus]|uniref:neuroendocrine convertase 1-like isoform X1 n=1 Tax=Mytilus californianus TaxID=6549 RepID=UPI0022453E43|nr:neuroendocrine convertase 1-like isoform X1 [Mytilus californianus]XP_052094596.1 neuroendocrine convertase 1-like isoform X1 [Mytilus californianus]